MADAGPARRAGALLLVHWLEHSTDGIAEAWECAIDERDALARGPNLVPPGAAPSTGALFGILALLDRHLPHEARTELLDAVRRELLTGPTEPEE